MVREAGSGEGGIEMEGKRGFCPKCGNPVVLTEYGRYLSKEFQRFEHVFEGWCPNCVERVVVRDVPEKTHRREDRARLNTAG
jgi:predicted RNA-binding Zn-ribbon protein involved in translation (DUF1610 family)